MLQINATIVVVLQRIYIHNYKCLVGLELELGGTVLLSGGNGVGKTAVIDVLFGLCELLSGTARITDRIAFPPSTLTRWQGELRQVFELDAVVHGECFRYRLEIEHDPDRQQSRIGRETLMSTARGDSDSAATPATDPMTLFECELGGVQLYRDDGSEGPSYTADWRSSALAQVVPHWSNTRLSAFMDEIRATVICTIRPELLGAESSGEEEFLDRDAVNFVDWYRHVVQETPTSVGGHVDALRAVIGGFADIHLRQSGLDSRVLMLDFDACDTEGRLDIEHDLADGDEAGRGSGRYRLRFDEISDGQRALVVLYALLHLRQDGGVMFLDDPDDCLALPEIQSWLTELAELCEKTSSQAVVCSRRPEIVDCLGPGSGLFLHRDESGATTVRPTAPAVAAAPAATATARARKPKLFELIARRRAG